MPARSIHIRSMVLAGILASLMAVCAWISIPLGNMTFTMQLFAVFLALGLLGGKWGSISIGIYLLLGAVGMPVFSGFRGGIAVLLGPTGGYILGFLALGLVYWLATALLGLRGRILGLILGLLACYVFGSAWFSALYGGGILAAALTCVLPYLLPDGLKLLLALSVCQRVRPFLK